MSTSSYKTPGVYIQELPAFGNTIVGVQTGVPAFLGYTQKAGSGTNTPVAISSMAEFEQAFGTGPALLYNVTAVSSKQSYDIEIDLVDYTVLPAATNQHYLLYNSMQLFFANGGGNCYVVSVGAYGKAVALADLQAGLTAIGKQAGPTMLVAPDAILLPSSGTSATLYRAQA